MKTSITENAQREVKKQAMAIKAQLTSVEQLARLVTNDATATAAMAGVADKLRACLLTLQTIGGFELRISEYGNMQIE